MKNRRIGYFLCATITLVFAFGCQTPPAKDANTDVLYQYSTIGSLLEGVFDGEITFGELKNHGDFGLGTFNALDGEMIELDHHFYQIHSDGAVVEVDDAMKTPFAVVTFFEPDHTVVLDDEMDCGNLEKYLDSILPTENIPYAIKITGVFSYIKARSVPRQEKPYPLLEDVIKEQSIFEFHDAEGAMVGFRLPGYIGGMNAAGYHFHFLNKDRDAGGHVLECLTHDITLEIDDTNEWYVVLPGDREFYDVEIKG
jgi:acetolactate decarboxylase